MSAQSDNLEVEVKFYLTDLTAVRQLLLNAGASITRPRLYERNLRLDTPDETLLQKRQLLRVRHDTAVIVTFKGDPPSQVDSEAKVREELEIEVSDLDTAVAIFQRLGFSPVQVYEKYRETFQWQTVEIVLDELPFGNFIELEGSESAIKAAAAALNLDWDKRILHNYLALMGQLQLFHNLPFNDLTFANFDDRSYSIADILSP